MPVLRPWPRPAVKAAARSTRAAPLPPECKLRVGELRKGVVTVSQAIRAATAGPSAAGGRDPGWTRVHDAVGGTVTAIRDSAGAEGRTLPVIGHQKRPGQAPVAVLGRMSALAGGPREDGAATPYPGKERPWLSR
jgi:hypothetical protein